MHFNEAGIREESVHYYAAPSALAKSLYYYVSSLGHFYVEPPYYVRRMDFNSFLLLQVEDGALRIASDKGARSVPAGGAMLMDCHRPHCYYAEGPCEFRFIHFNGANSAAFHEAILKRHDGQSIFSNGDPARLFLRQTLERFAGEPKPNEEITSIGLHSTLCALLRDGESPASRDAGRSPVAMTEDYIHQNLSRALTVAELAEVAGYSVCYFTRKFRSETGMTPYHYVLASRISRSKQLLTTTDFTVQRISEEVGFGSPENFIHAFTKETGISPERFRKIPL